MRVLTVNIWARSGPYGVREQLLRLGLARLAPDVVALQEVESGPGTENQAEQLLAPLGYQVVYEQREGESVADPGLAVASRYPVTTRQLIELPHGGAAVAARLATGDGALWFCCAVPMPGWPGLEGQREDEAIALDEALTDLADGDELPPVLAGDFDATPDAASIRFLSGLQSLQGRSTVWYDTWAVAGDHSPGHTWTSDNPYVAPFAAAVFAQPIHHRRIDYIFVGSPFRWRPRIAVRSCQVVLKGDQTSAPSDHYGVLADLDLNGITLGQGRGLDNWAETADLLWPQ